jgi:hypothetical protein
MSSQVAGPRSYLGALAIVALVGSVDVGTFIATSPDVALKNGGRAGGSIGSLLVWLMLLGVCGRRLAVADDSAAVARATVALGGLAALGGVGLAVIHQVAGVGGVRTLGGGALGVIALVLAIGARGNSKG